MKELLLALVLIPALLLGQSRKERKAIELQQKADQPIINNFINHDLYLNPLNAVGTNAPRINVLEYVANQFNSLGLQAKGTNSFIQSFSIDDGKIIKSATFLKVNDHSLELNKDYFPLSNSAQKKITGMPSMALRERGVPWFADLKDWYDDENKNAEKNINETLKKEVLRMAGKGATALFLFNTGTRPDSLQFNKNDKSSPLPIPVVYLTREGYKKYFGDNSETIDIELNVAFSQNFIRGDNIVGYIDNGAKNTVVVGTHFKFGRNASISETGNPTNPEISTSAENGVGLAMLIELARMVRSSQAKGNNFLFIAFSGINNGSTAAKYWLDNLPSTSSLNYMFHINIASSDLVSKVFINGHSSSPIWREVCASSTDKSVEVILENPEKIPAIPGSFYKKGIPFLSFSAVKGGRDQTAETEKKKYNTELQVIRYIKNIIDLTDPKGKLSFSGTNQKFVAGITEPLEK